MKEDSEWTTLIDNDSDEEYITKCNVKIENGLKNTLELENHKSNHRKKRNYKKHSKNNEKNIEIKIRKPRPEMCEICGTMQKNLKMHLRVHGNVIVFECDHCGRKFNQKSNIKTHFKVHLNERYG